MQKLTQILFKQHCFKIKILNHQILSNLTLLLMILKLMKIIINKIKIKNKFLTLMTYQMNHLLLNLSHEVLKKLKLLIFVLCLRSLILKVLVIYKHHKSKMILYIKVILEICLKLSNINLQVLE